MFDNFGNTVVRNDPRSLDMLLDRSCKSLVIGGSVSVEVEAFGLSEIWWVAVNECLSRQLWDVVEDELFGVEVLNFDC